MAGWELSTLTDATSAARGLADNNWEEVGLGRYLLFRRLPSPPTPASQMDSIFGAGSPTTHLHPSNSVLVLELVRIWL